MTSMNSVRICFSEREAPPRRFSALFYNHVSPPYLYYYYRGAVRSHHGHYRATAALRSSCFSGGGVGSDERGFCSAINRSVRLVSYTPTFAMAIALSSIFIPIMIPSPEKHYGVRPTRRRQRDRTR